MVEISVIVPVYNADEYLQRCVDSILNQSFADFELILVDDGSTDSSGIICDKYSERDRRVRVIHKTNGGAATARNKALDWVFENSCSKWICFIDSDDWVRSDYLIKLISPLAKGEAQCSVCYHETTSVSCEKMYEFINEIELYDFESFYSIHQNELNFLTPWGKIFPREWFSVLRYPEGKISEDIFVIPKALSKANKIALVKEKLYYYYLSPESVTRQKWSEKRYNEIEGYQEIIAFMKDNYFMKAYAVTIEMYYSSLDRQIKLLQKNEYCSLKVHRNRLRNLLIQAIWKYHRVVPVSFTERFWLLEDTYPTMMKIYWKITQVFGK